MTVPSKQDLQKLQDKIFYWKIIKEDIVTNKKGKHFLCQCVCGEIKEVFYQDLKRGKSRCCNDCSRISDPLHWCTVRGKHGLDKKLTNIPCYMMHGKMLDRCNNPNNPSYDNYGGRGITVCKDWEDIITFIDWAYSNGYQENLTIERKDVNGDYCPENCTWILPSEQVRNRRKHRNNKTGTTGVWENDERWVAGWYEEGKLKTKSFSKKKYGSERAKTLAIDSRSKALAMLREAGVEYGVWHGL